jgi:HAD superfamily hydrolase (TIGR01490 family)
MKKGNTAAFFDFDGTLYNGVIAFDFIYFRLKERTLGLKGALLLPSLFCYYMIDKLGITDRYTLNKRIYAKVKGWNSHSLESSAIRFFEIGITKNGITKKLFPEMLNLLSAHKKEHHKVVIVTSALREIISPISRWVKIDDVIATEVGVNHGIYNGMIKTLPVGKNRIGVIRAYCEANGIDMKKSYAYSDHHSDIPMLEGIGNPAAANPDRKLRKYAEKKGWRIIEVK